MCLCYSPGAEATLYKSIVTDLFQQFDYFSLLLESANRASVSGISYWGLFSYFIYLYVIYNLFVIIVLIL